MLPALEAWNPNHWTARKPPWDHFEDQTSEALSSSPTVPDPLPTNLSLSP